MIGDGYSKSHKIEHRIHEPFGLAQPHSEHTAQRQGRFDGKIGIPGLTTSRFSPWCAPSGQCFRRHPQCKTATPTQTSFVFPPIRHPEFHLCDVMTTIGVVFVRHGTRIKLIAILFAYRRTVQKLFMHQSHAPSQFVFDFLQLGHAAVPSALAEDLETALPHSPADVGEAKKVERLQFTNTVPLSTVGRIAAKLDQSGLVRMELQPKLLQPFTHHFQKALAIGFVFETNHGVIGITHDDHAPVASRRLQRSGRLERQPSYV